LAVLGGVLTAAAPFAPEAAGLLGTLGAGASAAPALDNSDNTGNDWDPVIPDLNSFQDSLNKVPGDKGNKLNVIGWFETSFSYFNLTSSS
jgi:hypothetical protein